MGLFTLTFFFASVCDQKKNEINMQWKGSRDTKIKAKKKF